MKPLFAACFFAPAGLVATASPVIHRDLAYAEPKNERQCLDVYAPAGGTKNPMVVWIHGGAWERGDKSAMHLKPQAFVDHGCVFVTINHRFAPKVTIREIAGDVAKAVRFAHDNAARFGGDPDSIFVMGHSSGAHLAALVCTDERYLQAEGLSFSILEGCVPVDGNTFDVVQQVELSESIHYRPPFRSHREKFGATAMQRELSPITYVVRGRKLPPFLILHIADFPESKLRPGIDPYPSSILSNAQTQGLQAHLFANALLRVARVPVRVVAVPDKDHGAINADLGLPGDPGTKALFEFVAERVKAAR